MPSYLIEDDDDFPVLRSRRRSSNPISSLELVEAIEKWAGERKKKIEEGLKKKDEEKNKLGVIQYMIIFTVICPWILLIQGLALYSVASHFIR